MNTTDTVYCAAITPMQRNYEIDFGGLRSNLSYCMEQGLGGVLVCGGTGEFVSLKEQERRAVVEVAARAIDGRTGFMVGCAAETTAEAISHARHAQAHGADALLLICSYYFKPSPEELYEHFRAVAQSVEIPIVLYNNPASCGSDIDPEMVRRLSAIPNITRIKEAADDPMRVRELLGKCPDGFGVLCGNDGFAYDTFKNGGCGWISITANALPSQSQTIFDWMREGRAEEALALYTRFLPLYTICEKPYKAIQTIKFIMDEIGCCGGASRPPRLELTPDEKEKVRSLMAQCGLL